MLERGSGQLIACRTVLGSFMQMPGAWHAGLRSEATVLHYAQRREHVVALIGPPYSGACAALLRPSANECVVKQNVA
jgi:hypothetical protein